jgi:uncharacterized membrane protein SirB2
LTGYYSKIPPIAGILMIISGIVIISRFKLAAFSEGVPNLADTVDVCHRDQVLA